MLKYYQSWGCRWWWRWRWQWRRQKIRRREEIIPYVCIRSINIMWVNFEIEFNSHWSAKWSVRVLVRKMGIFTNVSWKNVVNSSNFDYLCVCDGDTRGKKLMSWKWNSIRVKSNCVAQAHDIDDRLIAVFDLKILSRYFVICLHFSQPIWNVQMYVIQMTLCTQQH